MDATNSDAITFFPKVSIGESVVMTACAHRAGGSIVSLSFRTTGGADRYISTNLHMTPDEASAVAGELLAAAAVFEQEAT